MSTSPSITSLPQPALPQSAFCGAHPAVPALDVCSRCGAFVCYDCLASAHGAPACEPCTKVLCAIDRRLPAGLKTAWVLAVLGAIAFPAGIAGAVMAGIELRQARRRFAPAPIEERAEGAIRTSFLTATVNLVILWNAWPLLRSLVQW